MGYFLSLSKATTEGWLNGCELLLLVSGLVLAYGAVGEYLEEHGKLPKWMTWTKEPKFIFVWMVAVSLIGEFAGDAGVYVFSGHLQSISDQEIKDANSNALDAATSAHNAIADAGTAHDLAKQASLDAGSAETKAIEADTKSVTAEAEAQGASSIAQKAGSDAESARGNAEVVAAQAQKLGEQIAAANGELSAAKNSLINMAVCLAPRVIPAWSLPGTPGNLNKVDTLAPFSQTKALIEFVPDTEARRAALNIAAALTHSGWKDVSVKSEPENDPNPIEDGVEIDTWVGSFDDVEENMRATPKRSNASSAGAAVERLLSRGYFWIVQSHPAFTRETEVPDGGIKIKVGLYPAVVYVASPAEMPALSMAEQSRKSFWRARARNDAKARQDFQEGLKKRNLPPDKVAQQMAWFDQQVTTMHEVFVESTSEPCTPVSGLIARP